MVAIDETDEKSEFSIRVYIRESDGTIVDGGISYDLSDFAGHVPSIGDIIIIPGVAVGLDRHTPANREFWSVVGRVLGALDHRDSIALVVEARKPTKAEAVFVKGR